MVIHGFGVRITAIRATGARQVAVDIQNITESDEYGGRGTFRFELVVTTPTVRRTIGSIEHELPAGAPWTWDVGLSAALNAPGTYLLLAQAFVAGGGRTAMRQAELTAA